VTNTKCRIDTVISPDDGHIVARNIYRKEIKILRKIVRQAGFIYKTIPAFIIRKSIKPILTGPVDVADSFPVQKMQDLLHVRNITA
jgi:hypothetical protein